ncbi:hypothetical protein Tco_0317462 [Tanacetum coccineum]
MYCARGEGRGASGGDHSLWTHEGEACEVVRGGMTVQVGVAGAGPLATGGDVELRAGWGEGGRAICRSSFSCRYGGESYYENEGGWEWGAQRVVVGRRNTNMEDLGCGCRFPVEERCKGGLGLLGEGRDL